MKRFFLCSLAAFALLAQDIASPDPKQRAKAAREATKAGPQGIARIAPLLSDPDVSVRVETVKAIVEIGSQYSLDPLVKALGDQDAEVQIRATDGLVNFYLPGYVRSGLSGTINRAGDAIRIKFKTDTDDRVLDAWIEVRPEIITALGKVVRSAPNMEVRANAARSLGILRGKLALDDLHAALRSKDTRLMYESLIALQKIRDPRSGDQIAFLFRDPEDRIASLAIETAGLVRAKSTFPEIQAVYKKAPSASVRRSALEAMAMLVDERARFDFVDAFQDKDEGIRAAAAEGLARLKDPNHIATLDRCFNDERKMPPRLACAFGLVAEGRVEMSPSSALTYLVNTLNSKAWKGVAEGYLVELARTKTVRTSLEKALPTTTREEKTSIARILSSSGDKDSITALQKLSQDSEPEVVDEALRALKNLRARLP